MHVKETPGVENWVLHASRLIITSQFWHVKPHVFPLNSEAALAWRNANEDVDPQFLAHTHSGGLAENREA